ncbi:MAG: hypothetical protein ACR2GK_07210 [Gemmatimonadaceae bacterium]
MSVEIDSLTDTTAVVTIIRWGKMKPVREGGLDSFAAGETLQFRKEGNHWVVYGNSSSWET